MAEWIATSIIAIGAILTMIRFIRSTGAEEKARQLWQTAIEKRMAERDVNVEKGFEDMKRILGNGAYHGIRQDIQDMKVSCAGAMGCVNGEIKEVRVRLSAQQHEIDELKQTK
jgi:hypothetical protein